ncbi:unnamed protein product [Choristocarpus tenellus]
MPGGGEIKEPPLKRQRGERGGIHQKKASSILDGGHGLGKTINTSERDSASSRSRVDLQQGPPSGGTGSGRADPCSIPFEGPHGLPLAFNYWAGKAPASQVLTSEVQRLVVSVLMGSPMPAFAGSWDKVRKGFEPKRVAVACVSGIGMADAKQEFMSGTSSLWCTSTYACTMGTLP